MNTKRLGKLHSQYDFFLNPYDDLRFTHCPKCSAKTGYRKLPLVICLVEPQYPISLNYTCLYCQTCDLLIAHKNEIDDLLAKIFHARAPGVVGNNYTIIGTMEKSAWKQGVQKPLDFQNMLEHLHDFNQVLKFELTPNLSEQEPLQFDTKTLISSDRSGKREHKEGVSTHNSVDDVTKAIKLVEMMKLALPITARPTKDLVHALKKQGMQLDPYRDVQIKDVYYMGDEGGVTCNITPSGKETTPVLCSITHLLIPREHPLFNEIRLYQKAREGRLAENFGAAGFTINPKKRH
jgi:hypothetical protein